MAASIHALFRKSKQGFWWLNSAAAGDHKQVIDPDTLTTLDERLGWVKDVCGYRSWAEFARALGESEQTVLNWRRRGTLGQKGPKVNAVTGASSDWLLSGRGVKFPQGILKDGVPVADHAATGSTRERLEGDIDQLRIAVAAFADWAAFTLPGAGEALSERLRAVDPYYARRGFHARLLQVIEAAQGEGEAERRAAPPLAARESSSRKKAS